MTPPRQPAPSDPTPEQEREQQESEARVQAGGIPLAAERRLRELGEGTGAFTSDLSVGSFALCNELGLTPLGQVMGSSVYQVGGYGGIGYGGGAGYAVGGNAGAFPGVGTGGFMYELDALSGAWNEARDRAFARLAQEATHLRGDAVVGVKIDRGEREFAEGAVECLVTGTAIRGGARRSAAGAHDGAVPGGSPARGAAPDGSPAPMLTELSVADYAKLRRAGIQPLGVVAWTAIYLVQAWGAGQLGGAFGLMQNQELHAYTAAVYEARESVMARVTQQAARIGASGVVGMRVSHSVRPAAANGLVMSFDAIGTAIRQDEPFQTHAPKTIVDLTEGAST